MEIGAYRCLKCLEVMSMQFKQANRTDSPSTMYEIVQGWAERTPDAPALVAMDCLPLTYGALAEVANRFQRSLSADTPPLSIPNVKIVFLWAYSFSCIT